MISEKAATVLATIGTVCWCVQLIPQIWYNWRRKDCTGFPPLMMFLWAACGVPFSIYFISTRANIVVQVQPELFFVFCLTSWVQTLYYPPVRMPKRKIALIAGTFIVCAAALEGGFISYLRPMYDDGKTWPTLIFGVIASVLLALGLVPPYVELAKRRGRVVGIHFLFLFIDLSGAVFSALSVAFGNMDIMGIVLYCICAAMEIGIFTSHFVWLCRFRWFGHGDLDDEEKSITDVAECDDTYEKPASDDLALGNCPESRPRGSTDGAAEATVTAKVTEV